jgi:lipopolysaccharide assembly outer membrane protein LptD (OstA)
MQKKRVLLICFLLITCMAVRVYSQQLPIDPSKRINIIIADRYNYQKVEGVGDFISLTGNVQLRQEKTLFYCDSAVVNQSANTIEALYKQP